MLGSFFMAISTNFTEAMLSRGIEGLSAGILLPLAPILIQESFPEKLRPAAMSTFALSSAMWVTLGPTIGGFIIDNPGWQWAFAVNIPIGFLAIFFAQLFLSNHPRQDPRQFDGTGFMILAIALGCLFTGYMGAEWVGWHSTQTVSLLLAGLLLFFLFWIWSSIHTDPILPTEVLKKPLFLGILVVVFLQSTQSFGRLYLLAPYLEKNYHFMAHNAGELIAVGALTEVLVSLSFLFSRFLAGQWPVLLASGCILVSISNIDFLILPATGFSLSFIVKSQLIFGAGLALTQISIPPVAAMIFPAERIRAATTYLLFFQFIGGAWGTMLGRHLVLHVKPVFSQMLPQLSSRPATHSDAFIADRLSQAFTSNIIFYDLGLIGLLGGMLAISLIPFLSSTNHGRLGKASSGEPPSLLKKES
jgi:DHA2 family multidrug resistance protein